MAKTDEDWKNFMNSINETGEDVETDDDESTEDETEQEVEEEETEDESKKSKKAAKGDKADESEEDTEEEESDEDDDAEDADKDKGKKSKSDTYKPRLSQFLNEDGSVSVERLEKSYIENSKEAVRLKSENEDVIGKYNTLVEAIKSKPEVAEALFGKEGAKNLTKGQPPEGQQRLDPYSAHIKAQMENQSKKDYNDFADAHPEIATDSDKAKKIGSFLKLFGQQYREENGGEIPSMKQGLEAAYRYYGWGATTEKEKEKAKKKEDVASAAKKKAATVHTSNKKTPVSKQKKSELEGFFAQKLGVKVK